MLKTSQFGTAAVNIGGITLDSIFGRNTKNKNEDIDSLGFDVERLSSYQRQNAKLKLKLIKYILIDEISTTGSERLYLYLEKIAQVFGMEHDDMCRDFFFGIKFYWWW